MRGESLKSPSFTYSITFFEALVQSKIFPIYAENGIMQCKTPLFFPFFS